MRMLLLAIPLAMACSEPKQPQPEPASAPEPVLDLSLEEIQEARAECQKLLENPNARPIQPERQEVVALINALIEATKKKLSTTQGAEDRLARLDAELWRGHRAVMRKYYKLSALWDVTNRDMCDEYDRLVSLGKKEREHRDRISTQCRKVLLVCRERGHLRKELKALLSLIGAEPQDVPLVGQGFTLPPPRRLKDRRTTLQDEIEEARRGLFFADRELREAVRSSSPHYGASEEMKERFHLRSRVAREHLDDLIKRYELMLASEQR